MLSNSTRTSAFQAASGFFETNREVPAFFFQNCRKFLNFKTPTPRAKKVGRKPDPPGSGSVQIPGGRPGGSSGLELTDNQKLVTLFLVVFCTLIAEKRIDVKYIIKHLFNEHLCSISTSNYMVCRAITD